MDKIEYRAFIKLFVKEGLTPNEINSKFIKDYGDSSPSFSKIKKWAAEFKCGRTSLEDDPREGRPKSATTPEITEQVHDMIYIYIYIYIYIWYLYTNTFLRSVRNSVYSSLYLKRNLNIYELNGRRDYSNLVSL
jgi:hypothetical protein